MLRTFFIETDSGGRISVTESTKPDTVAISLFDQTANNYASIELTRKQFEQIANLASYSSYARNNIEWAKEPEQPELPLPPAETPDPA